MYDNPFGPIQINRYNTATFSDGRTLDELLKKMRIYLKFAALSLSVNHILYSENGITGVYRERFLAYYLVVKKGKMDVLINGGGLLI